jgi:hypothetical protein
VGPRDPPAPHPAGRRVAGPARPRGGAPRPRRDRPRRWPWARPPGAGPGPTTRRGRPRRSRSRPLGGCERGGLCLLRVLVRGVRQDLLFPATSDDARQHPPPLRFAPEDRPAPGILHARLLLASQISALASGIRTPRRPTRVHPRRVGTHGRSAATRPPPHAPPRPPDPPECLPGVRCTLTPGCTMALHHLPARAVTTASPAPPAAPLPGAPAPAPLRHPSQY